MSNLTPRVNRIDIPDVTSPSANVILNSSSSTIQLMNPSTDIDVTLPADKLTQMRIENQSTNLITVKSSNGDTLGTLRQGGLSFFSLNATPTTGSDWLSNASTQLISFLATGRFDGITIQMYYKISDDGRSVTMWWSNHVKSGAGSTSNDPFIGSGFIPTAIRPPNNISHIVWTDDGSGLVASRMLFEKDGGWTVRNGTNANAWTNSGNATFYGGSITWSID